MANPIAYDYPHCLFIGGSMDGERQSVTFPAICTEQPAIEIRRPRSDFRLPEHPIPWLETRTERYVPREVPYGDLFTTVVMALDFLSETEVLEGYARLTKRPAAKDTTHE